MTEPTATKVSVRGCGIAMRRAGTGRPLLYLHGASDPGQWLPFLADLAARHDVLAPEHPGFGASDTPDWLDSIQDLARFYLDLLDQLDVKDVDLVGHSLGGWIAAELAVRNTRRLNSLTLVSSAGLHVPRVPPADTFLMSDEELARTMYHNPKFADEMLKRAQEPSLEDVQLKNRTTTAK